MAKVSLVLIESPRIRYEEIFRRAFDRIKIDPAIHALPFVSVGDTGIDRLRTIRSTINTHKKLHGHVIFCPGTAELYLTGADHLFVFSAYREWTHKGSMSVLPHAWPTIPLPASEAIKWTNKPPLTIGFMGTGYTKSRLGSLISSTPATFRRALLRGDYLKHPGLLAVLNDFNFSLKNLNTFARAETIRVLKQNNSRAAIEVVDQAGFGGTDQEKQTFSDHLIRNTYVVCPRGIENFSFRVYEALRYGRVPVIIDTGMVLPREVDWDRVAIRLPYEKLSKMVDVVLHDYNSKTHAEFLDRQQCALDTIRYLDSDAWLDNLLIRCLANRTLSSQSHLV